MSYDEEMYEVLNKFMVRIPTLPLNYYNKYFNTESINLQELIDNNKFLEGISVASKNLYNALVRKKEGKINKEKQLENSIKKYLIRMSTRPTPYGTFSGVSLGEFSDESNVNFKEERFKKRARVDYEWLIEVIKKLDIDFKLYKKVKLFTNNSLLKEGNKIKNSYLTSYNFNKNKVAKIRINNTSNVRFVLNMAKDGIYYKDILKKIRENTDVEEEVIENFIENLIKQEYLITELRPDLTEFDQLGYIIDQIRNSNFKNKLLDDLIKLKITIDKYNNSKLGEGIDLLEEIRNLMININRVDNLLQVDCRNNFNIQIKKNLKKEISKVTTMLNKISYLTIRDNNFKEYINNFLIKYGEYREVPIIDLLDDFIGLPFEMQKNIFEGSEELDNKSYFIKKKILESIALGSEEIILHDSELKKFYQDEYKTEDYFDTLEMYIHIISDTIDELDKDKYTLYVAPSFCSTGAGKTMGRFTDLLEGVRDHYKEIKDKKNKLSGNEVIRAELMSNSSVPRMSNVTITENYEDYQINIVTLDNKNKKTIKIDDIYVGIEKENLYLKSKSLNKKIEIVVNHMGSILGNNKLYKFMVKVFEEGRRVRPSSFISYSGFKDFSYIPRIRYSKTIINPAMWVLNKYCILESNNGLDLFMQWIDENRRLYKMPQFIYLTEADNRLLINTENISQLEYIYDYIKKSNSNIYYFQEFEYNIKKGWIKEKDNIFVAEFVFQLIKKKQFFKEDFDYISFREEVFKTNSDITKLKTDSSNNDIFRKVDLFDEWIYFKVYQNEDFTDEFIGVHIRNLISILKEKKLIEKHFYIVYKDTRKHIRLRIKSKCRENNQDIYNIFNDWYKEMLSLKILNNVVMEAYEKEIERYGGPEVIELAEDFFDKQSTIIEEYINLLLDRSLKFNKIEFVLANMVFMMENLGVKYLEQLELLERTFERDLYRKEFRQKSKRYMSICNLDDTWKELKALEDGEYIYSLINYQKESLKELANKIDDIDKKGQLFNSKIDIIYSLLHMLCNRVFGIDKDKEKFTMYMLRHSIYALKYKKINNK